MRAKGLVGRRGVQTKAASPGWVRKRSSVQVFLSVTKMPSGVKCKRPQRVARRPSRKSYATKGTSTPSKNVSQSGGNCPKRNLMESTNEDSK